MKTKNTTTLGLKDTFALGLVMVYDSLPLLVLTGMLLLPAIF